MTAHSKDQDEALAIGHSVMNNILEGAFTGNISDSAPALDGEQKEKFFKILSGSMDKDEFDFFKRSIIKASSIMSGRLKDPTDGSITFKKGKIKGSDFQTPNYSFYKKTQGEGVISQNNKKSGKSRKTLKG